jgi:hypothetical protein
MEKFKLAADPQSHVLMKARIETLYDACQTLAAFGRSWCPIEDLKTTHIDLPEKVSKGSEEHHQLARALLHIDEICSFIGSQGESKIGDLGLPEIVNLYWCLAISGRFEANLIGAIQKRISLLSTSGLDIDQTCKVLFSEATFFHRHSKLYLSFDEDTFASFPFPVQANLLQSLAVIAKDLDLISRLKKNLVSATVRTLKHGSQPERDRMQSVAPFVARTAAFVAAITNQNPHHEIGRFKSLASLSNRLPPWKYAFELCLACHAVAAKGVELNPAVEQLFTSDVLYLPPKRKNKLVIELQRPGSLVWRFADEEVKVFGVDIYTRIMRLSLAQMGYRIISITLNEWLKLKGAKSNQMTYVKRRIRNCLRQKRLFSGMERDEIGSGSEEYGRSDDSSDSDMSY